MYIFFDFFALVRNVIISCNLEISDRYDSHNFLAKRYSSKILFISSVFFLFSVFNVLNGFFCSSFLVYIDISVVCVSQF